MVYIGVVYINGRFENGGLQFNDVLTGEIFKLWLMAYENTFFFQDEFPRSGFLGRF
jgi:hypothetical protein